VGQELSQGQGMARSIFIRQELTRECEALVTVQAIALSVLISLTEISPVEAILIAVAILCVDCNA
jgi:hypothetical protein